jgi:hypothetical protein
LLILFFLPVWGFSQTLLLKGIVKDELTSKPIPEVNIKIYGTTRGNSTDRMGGFSLQLSKLPVTLVISCIGYEEAYFDVSNVPNTQLAFLLRPKSYTLPEVDISSAKYSFLYKDKDYSVLDYELMGDNVLIMIYRYQLKQSELVLLNRSGDTLALSKLPELPPASLYKDFLLNVHYFSKNGNAYQCFFNEHHDRIEFFKKTTVDSLFSHVKPFLFQLSDRLYFQEKLVKGFGTAIGYYQKGTGKKYIRKCLYDNKISEYFDDQTFYNKWNTFIGNSNALAADDIESDQAFDFSRSGIEGGAYGKNEARAHEIEYFNMIFPVVKTKDNTIAFFNFGSDKIEFMDENGKTFQTVPIDFHKEIKSNKDSVNSVKLSNTGWRWGTKMLVDDYSHNVYTIFIRKGMVKIHNVNTETGKLNEGTILPYPFPEKIEIYRGDAYFLVKNIATDDKWDLVKCRVD